MFQKGARHHGEKATLHEFLEDGPQQHDVDSCIVFPILFLDLILARLEAELGALFGPTTTLGDIARATPEDAAHAHDTPAHRARIEEIVRELEELAARSRRQSLSVLVPMGQEMAYRYQEGVVYETLAVLRDFLRRTRPA